MYDRASLRYFCNDRSSVNCITDCNGDMSIPQSGAVQKIYVSATGDKRTAGICDPLQRSFNTVKNVVKNSGSQRD